MRTKAIYFYISLFNLKHFWGGYFKHSGSHKLKRDKQSVGCKSKQVLPEHMSRAGKLHLISLVIRTFWVTHRYLVTLVNFIVSSKPSMSKLYFAIAIILLPTLAKNPPLTGRWNISQKKQFPPIFYGLPISSPLLRPITKPVALKNIYRVRHLMLPILKVG